MPFSHCLATFPLKKIRRTNSLDRIPDRTEMLATPRSVVGEGPSPVVAGVVSAIVAVHCVVVAVGLASGVGASSLQSSLLGFARPYLSLFHASPDTFPIALATSTADEKTHLLWAANSPDPQDDNEWTDTGNATDSTLPGGSPGSDSQRRWQRYLSLVAELGEGEQGDLAARLFQRIVAAAPMVDEKPAKVFRITRDPDLMTNVLDDSAPAPYVVAVLPGLEASGSRQAAPRLMQIAPGRLAAPTIRPDRAIPSKGDSP